jgi:hypothetical protein
MLFNGDKNQAQKSEAFILRLYATFFILSASAMTGDVSCGNAALKKAIGKYNLHPQQISYRW